MKEIMGVLQVIKKRIDYFLFKVSNTLFARNIRCGYYDKHLDEINVRIEDCSFSEIYCGKRIALMEKNHIFGKKYMGFMIFGVRHFLLTHQVNMCGMHEVKNILQEMVELCSKDEFPSNEMKIIYKILRKNNPKIFIPPISR
jgi:hypothetical protein